MKDAYEIAAEDGSLLCKCRRDQEEPILYSKSGGFLRLSSLIEQAHHPEVAKRMRKRKPGKRPNTPV